MQNAKTNLIKTVRLAIKVTLLFITRQIVSKEDIGNSYNLISKSYQQEYLTTMHIYNEQLLEHLLTNLNQGKILDLAGGTGFNSEYIAAYGNYDIDLVDISKEMLEQCYLNINKNESGMLNFLNKQPAKKYDAIICTWALMYECPQKIIKECYQILKPRSYLYILVNDKQTLPQIRKSYPKLLIKEVSKINKLMLDLPTPKNQQQLDRWAKRAGFDRYSLETLRQDFIFDSWDKAAKFAISTGALAGYDIMIDLHDQDIFINLVGELEKISQYPCITHHFIKGIFYKDGD